MKFGKKTFNFLENNLKNLICLQTLLPVISSGPIQQISKHKSTKNICKITHINIINH